MKPYQYDPNKANANLKKHGISFDEAYTALLDEQALVMPDPDALDEERFVLLGLSEKGRLLTVIYTMRGNTPRLISARKSTDREKKHYA
ncbi:MAG: BrnT family toxin [Neisseriaceae bacterium]|nr:BrnT family toxin [Neisseriaceae bacterium]